jgi:hypothetical protein
MVLITTLDFPQIRADLWRLVKCQVDKMAQRQFLSKFLVYRRCLLIFEKVLQYFTNFLKFY